MYDGDVVELMTVLPLELRLGTISALQRPRVTRVSQSIIVARPDSQSNVNVGAAYWPFIGVGG